MAKVNLNLKSPSKEHSLIIIRYGLTKGRMNYSTGVTIPTKYWNSRQQRIRQTEEFPQGKQLQFILDEHVALVKSIHREFFRKDQNPTVEEFKSELDQSFGKSHPQDQTTLNQFIQSFIEERIASQAFRPQSIKVYKTLRNHFNKYVRNRKIHFDDLNAQFLRGFVSYLRKKNYSDNHVHKMVSTLRTILNEALNQGINFDPVHKRVKLHVRRQNADNIYLSDDEISALLRLDLSERPALKRTRDLFIIGCFTGLRYSDYSKLQPQSLKVLSNGRKAFRVIVQKTNDIIWIPIHPVVQKILAKYNNQLPAGTANQVMNRQLKEIARLAGITETYDKRIFRSNRGEVESMDKCDLVCTHTARRSFATNAYKAGIPVPTIMKITGHKQVETFRTYISLSNQEHALLMSENAFFSP